MPFTGTVSGDNRVESVEFTERFMICMGIDYSNIIHNTINKMGDFILATTELSLLRDSIVTSKTRLQAEPLKINHFIRNLVAIDIYATLWL